MNPKRIDRSANALSEIVDTTQVSEEATRVEMPVR